MTDLILTGASGFIGRHCLKHLLAAGHTVHALCRMQAGVPGIEPHPRLFFHSVDLLDQEAVRSLLFKLNAEKLLHLAWYAEPGKFWQSELNQNWLQASLHLLSCFAEAGGRRFVGAGSCAEYDWQHGVMHESTTPLKAETLYGRCKAEFFRSARIKAENAGLEFAWGRIFWLFGPYEDKRRVVPYVISSLLEGKAALCSSGQQERDFIYVDELARAFSLLLDSNLSGALNLGSGSAIAVKDLLLMIAGLTGKQELLKLGALASSQNEPPLVRADVSRLKNELAFQSSLDLKVALELTIKWWEEELSRQ